MSLNSISSDALAVVQPSTWQAAILKPHNGKYKPIQEWTHIQPGQTQRALQTCNGGLSSAFGRIKSRVWSKVMSPSPPASHPPGETQEVSWIKASNPTRVAARGTAASLGRWDQRSSALCGSFFHPSRLHGSRLKTIRTGVVRGNTRQCPS